jgi:hypothetical protein
MKSGSGPTDPFGEDDDERDESGATPAESVPETSTSTTTLPWIYRRESVQDGRVKTVQLHLQSEAAADDRELRARLQQQASQDLKKADFREAVFRAGLDRVDEVRRTLEEWGYEFEE